MQTDVLVLGAGPAGSALATQLAMAGFGVVLADQKDFPRDKPCGEFLSPECLPYLDTLGVGDAVRAQGPKLVRGMFLNGYGERALGRFRALADHRPHTTTGYGIRRAVFDHTLVQRAVACGVQWLPRHRAESLQQAADGRITGAVLRDAGGRPCPVQATWTVGADGVHSPMARRLGVQRPLAWLQQFALVGHFRHVAPAACAEVHLLPGGFFAATTVDADLFSVNLVLPKHHFRDRQATDWDGFVTRWCAQAPGLAERLRGAERLAPWRGIGPLAHTTTRQTFPGAALVGDAAGYVDPMTGEGIYFALFGARALGTALATAMHTPDRAEVALADYVAARRREIAPRARASAWLQRAIRHPWLVRTFLRSCVRHPALADLVVTLSGDTIHPRDLLSLRFWRAFQAARPA